MSLRMFGERSPAILAALAAAADPRDVTLGLPERVEGACEFTVVAGDHVGGMQAWDVTFETAPVHGVAWGDDLTMIDVATDETTTAPLDWAGLGRHLIDHVNAVLHGDEQHARVFKPGLSLCPGPGPCRSSSRSFEASRPRSMRAKAGEFAGTPADSCQ